LTFPIEPKVGFVFRYAYLWSRLHREGREEGDKDRPCLVLAIVAVEADRSKIVRALPITHSPPTDPAVAIEVPAAVKRRLLLDDERSWIVLGESNRFVWPGPDVRPIDTETGYFGALPPALFAEVKRRFISLAQGGAHAAVPRTE
jgi:hypothetical protein